MNIKPNNQVYNNKLLFSFGFLWINNFKVDNLTGKLSSNSHGKTVNKNPVNTLQKILETRGQQQPATVNSEFTWHLFSAW